MLVFCVYFQVGCRFFYGDDGCYSVGVDVFDCFNVIGDVVGNVFESIGEGVDVGLVFGGEVSVCCGGSGNGEEEFELYVDG